MNGDEVSLIKKVSIFSNFDSFWYRTSLNLRNGFQTLATSLRLMFSVQSVLFTQGLISLLFASFCCSEERKWPPFLELL